MKVILKQDVKKLGKRGEVVNVSDGYGRNYLIARGLAVPETKKSLEILGEQKAEEAAEEAKAVAAAKETAAKMDKMILNFTVKSGAEGRVFGSVSTKQITEALNKQGIIIDKRKILDTAPIQTLGVSRVRVELHKNVIGTIRVRLIGSEKQ
ncbi:MAG: 50S ribosomal protein L9 [Erysipelotrichaceae bacterium]|jgi:large subunit ribosomal protein L9|nr:50S ribosomal protein L9 [Erysipelotrichaceae bacterium]